MKASLKAMLEEHMIDFLDEIDGCRDNPPGLAHPDAAQHMAQAAEAVFDATMASSFYTKEENP